MLVQQLRDELSRFPPDATVYAYEGEVVGVVVIDPRRTAGRQLGVIECPEPRAELDTAEWYLVRYGRRDRGEKRYVLRRLPEGEFPTDELEKVFESDSKSEVVAEAQRRNGLEPADGSESTYGRQLAQRELDKLAGTPKKQRG